MYEGYLASMKLKNQVVKILGVDDELLRLTINGTVKIAVFDRLSVELKVVEPDVQHQRIQLKLLEPVIPDISVQQTDISPMDTSIDNKNNQNKSEKEPLSKKLKTS